MFFINNVGEYFISLLSGLGLKGRAARPVDLPAGHIWRGGSALPGVVGSDLFWYDGTSDWQLNSPNANRNFLYNGGFWFAQRITPGGEALGVGQNYGPDRWRVYAETNGSIFYRIDTSGAPSLPIRARYYGQFVKAVANGKLVVSQPLEGSDIMVLRGQNVRFQMTGLSNSTAPFRMWVLYLTAAGTMDTVPATVSAAGANGVDPTWGANLTALAPQSADLKATSANTTCVIEGNGLTCTLDSGSWSSVGGVFSIPDDAKNIVVVIGSKNQMVVNDYLLFSEVGLYQGTMLRPVFSHQSFGEELARCQRYYCKSFDIDTKPAQNAGTSTGETWFPCPKAGAVTNFSPFITYPVQMRVAGTGTIYNPSAGNAQIRDASGATDTTLAAWSQARTRGFNLSYTGNAANAIGDAMVAHWSIDVEL